MTGWSKFLLLTLVVIAVSAMPVRADEIVSVDAANIVNPLGTLNISMDLDVTTLSVVAGTPVAAFSTGALVGTQFNLAPICTNDLDCTCGAPLCSGFFAANLALFNFLSTDGNDLIQFGDDDYSEAFIPGLAFPEVGVYSYLVVSDGTKTTSTGFSYEQSTAGIVTVSPFPEFGSAGLLAMGMLALACFAWTQKIRSRPGQRA